MRKLLIGALLAAAIAGPVGAHAFLDRADPRVGSTVHAPTRLQLWFTQSLVTAFCRVTVSGPAGFAGVGPARAAPGDARSLVVDFNAPAPAGVYTVRWRVLSVDTHATEGDFTFKVGS